MSFDSPEILSIVIIIFFLIIKNLYSMKEEDNDGFYYYVEANGRLYIILDGQKFYVDILVAQTFLYNPDPTVYTEVEHIDGNITNNAVYNLRWTTKK